jgi:hypothetical protein
VRLAAEHGWDAGVLDADGEGGEGELREEVLHFVAVEHHGEGHDIALAFRDRLAPEPM